MSFMFALARCSALLCPSSHAAWVMDKWLGMAKLRVRGGSSSYPAWISHQVLLLSVLTPLLLQ